MDKEFIPYEQALALKEVGFDEPCLAWYAEDKNLQIAPDAYKKWTSKPCDNSNIIIVFNLDCITAPTYQSAFRWFREKHDLQASNIMFSNGKYDAGITRYKGTQSVWGHGPIYDTYEKAELACLNKLIELVKEKS